MIWEWAKHIWDLTKHSKISWFMLEGARVAESPEDIGIMAQGMLGFCRPLVCQLTTWQLGCTWQNLTFSTWSTPERIQETTPTNVRKQWQIRQIHTFMIYNISTTHLPYIYRWFGYYFASITMMVSYGKLLLFGSQPMRVTAQIQVATAFSERPRFRMSSREAQPTQRNF